MTINENTNENPVNDEEEQELVRCEWCEYESTDDEFTTVVAYNTAYERRRGIRGYDLVLCDGCSDRAYACEDCGRTSDSDESHSVGYSHTVCDPCYYENYTYCDSCGESYVNEDNSECPDCREQESSRLIHDYSFRPDPLFFTSSSMASTRDPRRISVTGFELEMEAVGCELSSGATTAHNIFEQWCYLKHDGSLNNGFEMVSHPMSHEFILEKFPWEKLRELSSMGMRSAQTRTCGLHVHINRSFFAENPTTMYRFMSMFYRNAEQWKKIAGRSESTYANWSEYELSQMLRYTKSLKNGGHSSNSDRYVALNLQNRNTIELRFFKGTLRPESFVGRLEAVHAVAQYANETRNRVSIKASHDWERFREWTIQNGFNHFNTYAESKGV